MRIVVGKGIKWAWSQLCRDSKGAYKRALLKRVGTGAFKGVTTNHLIGDMIPDAIACKDYKRVVLANILF